MGNTPSAARAQDRIFYHAKRGEFHQLKSLLDHLARSSPDYQRAPAALLDAQDTDGNTPLLVACIRGHYQVAELLIQRGASLAAQNSRSDGGSPLHEAVNRRHEHIVALLLRHGASPFVENAKSFTAMDFACQTRNVELLRRLECLAPWKGWLELKVPVALGLGAEWKRRWVVIAHRLPSPFAPPARRRTHVSLLCYRSTGEAAPDCRVWLDGARAAEVPDNARALARTNGRTPAQVEVRLHRSHAPPSGCAVSGNAREGYALQLRPDEGTYRGCEELRSFADTVNNRGRPVTAPGSGGGGGGGGVHSPMGVMGPTVQIAPPYHHHHQQQQQQQQQPAAAAAAAAPANLRFSPLSAAAGGTAPAATLAPAAAVASDADIARRMQEAEDEALARRLSQEQVAVAPGAAPAAAAQYPRINYQVIGGTASQPPVPSAGDSSYTMSTLPSAPLPTHSSADFAAPAVPTPAAPAVAAAPSAAPVRPSGPPPRQLSQKEKQEMIDECGGQCCICLSETATHAFVHGGSAHLCICEECAEDAQRKYKECPYCRQHFAMVIQVFST